MTRRVRITTHAAADFLAIVRYYDDEVADPEAGASLVDALAAKLEHLAGLRPMVGRPRDDLVPGVRSFAFDDYLLFLRYPEDDSVLEVIAVIHASRDLPAVFDERQ